MFEIYFSDLTQEAQERFLASCGLSSSTEGNYDVFPITAIPTPEMDREGAGTSENEACNEESSEASDAVELSDAHLQRLDEIDNAVYQLLLVILEKSENEYPWNMRDIGAITDEIVDYLTRSGYRIHRPAIVTDGDRQYIEEWEEPWHE